MAMTKKTVTSWDAVEDRSPFSYFVLQLYLDKAKAEGKTDGESIVLPDFTGKKNLVTNSWTDQAAANEYKAFIELLAANTGVTVDVEISDI